MTTRISILLSAALAIGGLLLPVSKAEAVQTNYHEQILMYSSGSTKFTSVCDVTVHVCNTRVGHFFYQPSTARPAGTTTQWMSYWFRSEGYFSSPGVEGPDPSVMDDHFAVALQGSYVLGDSPQGRGVIVGNVSGATGGCQNPPTTQIESYATKLSWLDPNSCGPKLMDNTWYKVDIHSNIHGWVAYVLSDANGNQLYSRAVQDPNQTYSRNNLTGYWFGDYHNQKPPNGNWRIRLSKVAVGWF